MLIKKTLKSLIVYFILQLATLHAYELDIKLLQHTFYKKVLINNIYHKRFFKTLEKKCLLSDGHCFRKEIKKLQKQYSLLNDSKLQKLYNKHVLEQISTDLYIKKLKSYLRKHISYFENSQFITFIDISKQLLFLLIYEKKHDTFHLIGKDLISTGDIHREKEVIIGDDHFLKTPTGIFEIKSGWRSEGEILDDKSTLPYGQKDRYVFYFGHQESVRYNTFDQNGTKLTEKKEWTLIKDKLSFALHAHQSSRQLGKASSHGCIRISNELNFFLDNHHVLHQKTIKEDKWVSRFSQAPMNPKYQNIAGRYLFIVDSLPKD